MCNVVWANSNVLLEITILAVPHGMNVSLVGSLPVRIEDWSHKFGVQLVNISFAIGDCCTLTLLETISIGIWGHVLWYVVCLCNLTTIYDHLDVSSYTCLHHISLNLQIFSIWANPSFIISHKLICKKSVTFTYICFFSYLICIEISAIDGRDIPIL